MHRRVFIGAVATTAVAATTIPSAFAREPAARDWARKGDYAALDAAAGACLEAGEACLRHCFGSLAAQETHLAACADLVQELVAAGRVVRTLVAAGSPRVAPFAEALRQTSAACRAECAKFPDIAACAALASACARCSDACLSTA